jgi:Lon protease-like protein
MRDFNNTEALPSHLPIFPLKGAILLPQAQLPLTIFEPRYLAMVRDALAGSQIIGMVQPQPAAQDHTPASLTPVFPAVFPVGGAGRIIECAQTRDGRYLITLLGIGRFQIVAEKEVKTPYRQACVDYSAYLDDGANTQTIPETEREALLAELKAYLKEQNMAADWATVHGAPDGVLINTLAMLCPFDVAEKQALLEASTAHERLSLIRMLMGFSRASTLKEHTAIRH